MKTIILAAGYATRLYPLTENTPKQLLNVGGRTIMGRMLDDLDAISDVHENVIVTNHKFVNHFKEWMDNATYCNAIHLLDDGSENENDRMGAVGDLVAAIEALDIDDDILVVYADSLLDFSFDTFVDFFKEKSASCIMYHPMDDEEELKKYYMHHGGTPHLDGAYTVFGEVIKGIEVVNAIQQVATDRNDRPLEDIKILSAKVK